MQTGHMVGTIVRSGLVLMAGLLLGDGAFAQPGGFNAEMMLDRMDQNDNGRLDPDEISESRFPIASMAERAGIDASRGLDADELEQIFEQMRQQGPGGFGRGGGFGGDRGGRGGFDRGGSNGEERGANRSRQMKDAAPPPRVTVDLQATYVPGDSNGDGQIELSEWIRWKSRAALADFLSLDRNSDGILTPRELAQADSAYPINISTVFPGANPAALPGARGIAPAANPPATSTMTDTTPTAAPAPAPLSSPPSSALTPPSTPPASATANPDIERHTASAQRQFRLLDRDRNGQITDLEWQRSIRLRPKFEAVGADLTQPMTQEQFTAFYLKFSTSG